MIYDRFQQEAINYINQGFSVIVSAPTGSGKTAIAEHIIRDCIEKKIGVIYTAPLKALSNQKFRDFQGQFGDKIGILTGDVSLNAAAPVLIMTTEILRNKILEEPQNLKKYSWVIFDEIHYIDNQERGTVWEESLIFLPPSIKILGLSATIPNIEEFSAWVSSINKNPIKVVIEDKRPVPLHFSFQCQNEVTESIGSLKFLSNRSVRQNKMFALVNHIRNKEGLPCIYFVFGRKRAEELAFELYTFNFLSNDEQARINSLFNDLCRRFDLEGEESAVRMAPLVKRGIAYHHAGMLPTLKEVIERLFTSRLLKVIFTTETFALGINMPARSVAFDEMKKFYGRFVRPLKTRDFYQMAGRAGRRGMDKEGYVYCRVNPARINFSDVKRIIYGQPEAVKSQLNTSYATILSLYERYREDIFKVYPLSFHSFQSNKNSRREGLRLIEAKLSLLQEMGYIEGTQLTTKGQFAKAVYSYELILSELYEEKILEHLDEVELGILAVSVAFEPRKHQYAPPLSRATRNIQKACVELYERIRFKERRYKIYPFSKPPFFNLSPAIEAWLRGASFQKTLQFTDTDEGEVIRYFRMAVQILREISESEASSSVLKNRITETIRVINRDIVDAEKQLRS
ncbi:MAG: DEAD/DEAH box helicase [Candidatus Omnitrophica bacterium]|nr:DEAD/DEAH box helicase [Candidatus Omnitrophota bacterium]